MNMDFKIEICSNELARDEIKYNVMMGYIFIEGGKGSEERDLWQ